MLNLISDVFGDVGYSTGLKLNDDELAVFRAEIEAQWLSCIKENAPSLYTKAQELGIVNYHLISNEVNHKKLWHKKSRILPLQSVEKIKQLPFMSKLRDEFGEFSISDAIDTEQHNNREEIYWRLVRPNSESDVGPLHKDEWFHGAANSGYGMFSKDVTTIKIWIPIFCEPGKSGLALAAGSHKKEWKYHIEYENGMARPIPDEDLSNANAKLMPTPPGHALMFNQKVIHGGVLNTGDKTRVSAEITLVINQNEIRVRKLAEY